MDHLTARRRAIGVCGSGTCDAHVADLAQDLGHQIIMRGYTLICGGMFGVMGAACQGGALARQEGAEGRIVGILPGAELDGGNPHCDVVIPTGMGIGRNILVVLSSDLVVLVSGGAGTLSEAAYAWQLNKPIIALSTSGGCAAQLAGTSLDDRPRSAVVDARDPIEAVELAHCLLTSAHAAKPMEE